MAPFQAASLGWPSSPGFAPPVIKRVIRLDVPLEKFPNVSTDTCHHISMFFYLVLPLVPCSKAKHGSSTLLVVFWALAGIP